MYKSAITLGVKQELRKDYGNDELFQRAKGVFDKIGFVYILMSVEQYSTSGCHVHVFYVGKNIFWKNFNKLWGIGYVKNRDVYNEAGWMKYVKKQEEWEEHGCYENLSIMERFTGTRLEQRVAEIEIQNMYEFDYSDDDININIESNSSDEGDGHNLPI